MEMMAPSPDSWAFSVGALGAIWGGSRAGGVWRVMVVAHRRGDASQARGLECGGVTRVEWSWEQAAGVWAAIG